MKKIKIVQIGLGHDHATAILDSLLAQPQYFEVVGFAVPECEIGQFADRINIYENERMLKRMSIEEALAYPYLDAAAIETEEKNLTKYAQMAAERGIHLHIDKPGGFVLSDFEKFIETMRSKNLVLSMGYMYRFNPCVIEIGEKIKRGDFGKIYSIEAHMDCEHNKSKREWLAALPGGMMFFLGCHLVDLIYGFLGKPDEVIPYNTVSGINGVESEDVGFAVFKYQNGLSFVKTAACEPGGFMRRQLVICGEKETYEVRPLEIYDNVVGRNNMYSEKRVVKNGGTWNDMVPFARSENCNRYDAMMKRFAERIVNDDEKVYTYDYELELYKLVLAACGI